MSHLDMKVDEDTMHDVMECCDEWGITMSNSTINGCHRFWGEAHDLHVLRNSFS